MKNALTLLVLGSLGLAACGGSEGGGGEGMSAPAGTVTILEPSDGSQVTGPNVTVRLSTSGVQIVPAGDMTPGTGHHHLFLDADVTARDVPVPTVPGSIVHMGDASSQYTFENVAPGPHRLIAVVADGAHVPLYPLVVDTVNLTVR